MKFAKTEQFPYFKAQLTLSTSFVFISLFVMLLTMLIFVFYQATPSVSPCRYSRLQFYTAKTAAIKKSLNPTLNHSNKRQEVAITRIILKVINQPLIIVG